MSRVPSSGSTATSTSGPLAVADLLAVVEHRRLVLLALADHDDALHRDRVDHQAHQVDGRLVGGDLVAATDPARGAHRRRLRDPDELESEVPVGRRTGGIGAHSWADPTPAGASATTVSDGAQEHHDQPGREHQGAAHERRRARALRQQRPREEHAGDRLEERQHTRRLRRDVSQQRHVASVENPVRTTPSASTAPHSPGPSGITRSATSRSGATAIAPTRQSQNAIVSGRRRGEQQPLREHDERRIGRGRAEAGSDRPGGRRAAVAVESDQRDPDRADTRQRRAQRGSSARGARAARRPRARAARRRTSGRRARPSRA